MAFTNSVASSRLFNSELLEPSEAVLTTSRTSTSLIRIALQLISTVNRAEYPEPTPPHNPSQTFTVQLYPIGYNSEMDTVPLYEKTIQLSGETGKGSVVFDVVGVAEYKLRFSNTNSFGVSLSVGITEAAMT